MTSPSTAFVQALRVLGEPCGQTEVDWAVGMLVAGHKGQHLAMLASAHPPHNAFELAPLRDRALDEVDAAPVHDGWALYVYVAEVLDAGLAEGGDLVGAVRMIRELYLANEYDRALVDFYQLSYAHGVLEQGDEQWDWPGATRDTTDRILRERAGAFVAEMALIDTRAPARAPFSTSQRL